jgi:hypothetical protein
VLLEVNTIIGYPMERERNHCKVSGKVTETMKLFFICIMDSVYVTVRLLCFVWNLQSFQQVNVISGT